MLHAMMAKGNHMLCSTRHAMWLSKSKWFIQYSSTDAGLQ